MHNFFHLEVEYAPSNLRLGRSGCGGVTSCKSIRWQSGSHRAKSFAISQIADNQGPELTYSPLFRP